MQLARTTIVLALAAFPFFAQAVPTPNTPTTSNVGAKCTVTWAPDTTGQWKSMTIELMTGPNSPMTHLKTIATNIDATTQSTFTYPCPAVAPNAPIYFYQFSTAADPTSLTWSTRFGIADATGKLVAAPIATQPDGSAIPYGNGRLNDAKQADAQPAYLVGNGQNTQLGGGGGAAPAPGGSSAAPASSAPSVSSAPPSSSAPLASSAVPSSTTIMTVSAPASSSSTSSAPAITQTANGASSIKAGSATILTGLVALLASW